MTSCSITGDGEAAVNAAIDLASRLIDPEDRGLFSESAIVARFGYCRAPYGVDAERPFPTGALARERDTAPRLNASCIAVNREPNSKNSQPERGATHETLGNHEPAPDNYKRACGSQPAHRALCRHFSGQILAVANAPCYRFLRRNLDTTIGPLCQTEITSSSGARTDGL
jgi:hypothetical protein